MARVVISTLGDIQELPEISLPKINLNYDEDREIEEAATRFSEKRIIRAGRDAWEIIGHAHSFIGWKKIGAALLVGKRHVLRATGANAPWGRVYSHAFHKWMEQNGFGSMRKSDRSVAIELSENLVAIERWRATLPEQKRKRLKHAQSNVKAWRKANESPSPRLEDRLKAAETAWRRFLSCVEALPPKQAEPFLQRLASCQVTLEGQTSGASGSPQL